MESAEQFANIEGLIDSTPAGIVIDSSAVDPAKKEGPIAVVFFGKLTDSSFAELANTPLAERSVITSGITALTMPVPANILSLNAVIPGITMILSREVQFSNIPVPNAIASSLSPKVTSVRELQPLNTLLPIVVTLEGTLIVSSAAQPSNALSSIVTTELGIVTFLRSALFLNVPAGIEVRSLERTIVLS